MKFFNDNFKVIGYFNALLIVASIVFRLYFITTFSPLIMADSILCTITLLFGLFYSLSGYKKDAAKYYKEFMYLFFASSILSLCSTLYIGSSSLTSSGLVIIISNAIIFIISFVLAFIKDFGLAKSNILALVVLLLNIVKLVLVLKTSISFISIGFANLILACILCIFVSAKYADKTSRGAK